MNKGMKKMIKVAEKLDWSVSVYENEFMFSKFSPAGQDFNVTTIADNLEGVISEIKDKIDNFDCSAETYLWLDETGHGKRNAPYDMKELYEDMEACLKMMEELHEKLEEIND